MSVTGSSFRNSNIMTTSVTASLGGVVALALIIFSLYISIKYRCVSTSVAIDILYTRFSEWKGVRRKKLLTMPTV